MSSMKTLLTFVLLSSSCLAQTFWQGTHAGMTKKQLKALFGSDLKVEQSKPVRGYEGYTAYTMTREFCGGTFEVGFVLQAAADRLMSVTLITGSNAAGGHIGECVLKHYTAKYGQAIDAWDTELGITRLFVHGDTSVEVTTGPETDLVEVRYSAKAGG